MCKQIDMIMSQEREEKVERFMQLWEALDDGKKIELSAELPPPVRRNDRAHHTAAA